MSVCVCVCVSFMHSHSFRDINLKPSPLDRGDHGTLSGRGGTSNCDVLGVLNPEKLKSTLNFCMKEASYQLFS